MNSALLQLTDVRFAHGDRPAVQGVSLQLADRETMIVVGPSGCGKTSLLRLIAGLERPSSGSVHFQGRCLADPVTFVPPEQRGIGMVFQGLALFPHLSVAGNVGFGLDRVPKAERERRVQEELALVGLEDLGRRYPHELSGGQQQRTAIARALVLRPKLLLMDEPFSDLDGRTRSQVRKEVQRILQAHEAAAIIVTHDREDAFHLGDRIATMEDGRIVRLNEAPVLRKEWAANPFLP